MKWKPIVNLSKTNGAGANYDCQVSCLSEEGFMINQTSHDRYQTTAITRRQK